MKAKTKKKADKIKSQLSEDLGRPLRSQEISAIDSEEQRKAFLHYFYKYGGNIAAACQMVGITRRTFNRWLQKYPEISDYVEEVNEALLDLAEQQLITNIQNGKENSLFFFLCNKGKHRGWRDIRKLGGPALNAIKVEINYPDKRPELPHVDVKAINGEIEGQNTGKET